MAWQVFTGETLRVFPLVRQLFGKAGLGAMTCGVTDLQVEVLYSSTQYYFVVGLTSTVYSYPDIVAHNNRNI